MRGVPPPPWGPLPCPHQPSPPQSLLPPTRYEEEDEAILQQADADVLSERKSAMDEWQAFRDSKREFVALMQVCGEKGVWKV